MSYPIYNQEKLIQYTLKEITPTNIVALGDNQFKLIEINNLDGYYTLDSLLEFNQKFNFNLMWQKITDINDNKIITYNFKKFNGINFSKHDELQIILKPQMKVEVIVKCLPDYLLIIKNIRLKIIKEV